jgi:integrase
MNKVLTDVAIRNLKPGKDRREVPDAGARGLYVVIQPSGLKSFAVRYRYAGMPRKLTLTAGITLAAARKATADALYEVERGNDPSAAKRQAKGTQRAAAENTLRAVAEEYMKREGGRLRSADWRQDVLDRLVYPTLGDRPIADIRRSDVIRLLDKIEEGKPLGVKGGPVMADRTLAVIRKIMNWHATRSDDFRSPIVRGMARVKAKERARERTLTDDELRAVWKTAETTDGPFGSYVQFLLLTAARRNEASEMERAELLFYDRMGIPVQAHSLEAEEVTGADWTLPADRNKTKVDLVRPLSAAARDVLAKVPALAGCKFVFSTDGKNPISGFSRYKKRFDKASGITGWTLHDLRRTARSLMSRAGVNSDHAERCLGHVIAGVRGTYDRHEYHAEKQHAFAALASQVDRIVNRRDNVAVLPARALATQ